MSTDETTERPELPVFREDTVTYAPIPHSVSLARRRTTHLVSKWGYPALADDAALVVSELGTNALLHGSLRDRLIRVRLTVSTATLRAEVSDPRGERVPELRLELADEQFGRGLHIVTALTDRWWWEPRCVGKTVFAEWALQDRTSDRHAP